MTATYEEESITVGLTREELLLALTEAPVSEEEFVAEMVFRKDGFSEVRVSWCNSGNANDVETKDEG